jgi:putative tryptophan/tyrosine transport system substrate-binding protein
MRRHVCRRIAALLALALLPAPAALAQGAADKVFRLGMLTLTEESARLTRSHTVPALQERGFVEGRNLVMLERIGEPAQLPELTRELLAARPDAIIAISNEVVRRVREATSTVPIIMFGTNAVQEGFAASLPRPGGNVTGVEIWAVELDAKRLQYLHEMAPRARRVAILSHPLAPSLADRTHALRAVAGSADIELHEFTAASSDDYGAVFAAMRAAGVEALVIGAHPVFFRDAPQLTALALAAHLPTACEWAEMAALGCLLGYGPSRVELRRRLADYAARIFRGAAPGELPIEGPTRFELGVNLKIAKALGLTVAPDLLGRADEVIE